MGTQDNNDISPTVPVEHARPGFYTPWFLCTYNMQDDLSLLPKNLVTNHLIGMASFLKDHLDMPQIFACPC